MGKRPKDYDIATSATPKEIKRIFSKTLDLGIEFGVVAVIKGRSQIHVATFRKESAYSDGRHPDKIEYATAKDDVRRRDILSREYSLGLCSRKEYICQCYGSIFSLQY